MQINKITRILLQINKINSNFVATFRVERKMLSFKIIICLLVKYFAEFLAHWSSKNVFKKMYRICVKHFVIMHNQCIEHKSAISHCWHNQHRTHLYTEAEILIDYLRRRVVQSRIVMSASYDISLREKIESFWPKKLSHCRNYNSTWQSG